MNNEANNMKNNFEKAAVTLLIYNLITKRKKVSGTNKIFAEVTEADAKVLLFNIEKVYKGTTRVEFRY